MSPSPSPPPKPARKKKAFMFKRANLGDTSNSANDELSFFSRNRENYVGVVEPKEEKKPELKKKNTHDHDGVGSPPKRVKRLSTAEEDDDDGDDDSGDEVINTQRRHVNARQRYKNSVTLSDSDPSPPRSSTAKSSTSISRARDTSLTPPPVLYTENIYPQPVPHRPTSNNPTSNSRSAVNSRNFSPHQTNIVLSDDDDDDDNPVLTNATTATTTKAPLDEDAEMVAAIEARARARVAAANASNGSPNSLPTPPDPIVSILVTSEIEKTRPLILRRRINQSLKLVRSTWCDRQQFSEEQTADIFLTWKGNKVFDHNTCRGIGIGVDELGNLIEGDGERDGSVHFEAMTVEIWAERERERERRYTTAVPEEVPEVVEEVASLRLTLKSKGYDDFKLKVRPDTKIWKIIAAFRDARGVEAERGIALNFDGDSLDPDKTVGDTELEDMFGIDVYIS